MNSVAIFMLAHADAATREENDQRVELNSEQIVTTDDVSHATSASLHATSDYQFR